MHRRPRLWRLRGRQEFRPLVDALDGKRDIAGFGLGLKRLKLHRRGRMDVRKRRDLAHAGNHLDQNFLPFAVKLSRENTDTGGIAVGPCHRLDRALADHVVGDGEDRDCFGSVLYCTHRDRPANGNHIERASGKVGRIIGNQIHMRRPGAEFDCKVLSFDETIAAQLVEYCIDNAEGLACLARKGQHHAEAINPAGVLRAREDRPCRCRAAQACDKLAPFFMLRSRAGKHRNAFEEGNERSFLARETRMRRRISVRCAGCHDLMLYAESAMAVFSLWRCQSSCESSFNSQLRKATISRRVSMPAGFTSQ